MARTYSKSARCKCRQWDRANHECGYPRDAIQQAQVTSWWREALDRHDAGFKPIAQSLYIDLAEDPNTPPGPIHLGYGVGRRGLADLLNDLRLSGINHVALNLKFSRRPVADVLDEIGTEVIPHFSIKAS